MDSSMQQCCRKILKNFRKRLEEHITEMKKPFALVQVIPATFRSDYVPMYDMYREGKLDFDDLFNGMIYDRAVPNVDGVYFPDYSEERILNSYRFLTMVLLS